MPTPPPPPPLPQQAQQAKQSGCFRGCLIVCGILSGLFVILVIIGAIVGSHSNTSISSSSNSTGSVASSAAGSPERREGKRKIYAAGEQFVVGYTAYRVNGCWFSTRLSDNQFLDRPPDATYLFVDVNVVNVDKKERMIAPFKLLDESGAEYGTSDKAWMADGSIGLLTNLNPGVGKRAYVISDVPTQHQYRLLVSGGYWSGQEALVDLNPSSKSATR